MKHLQSSRNLLYCVFFFLLLAGCAPEQAATSTPDVIADVPTATSTLEPTPELPTATPTLSPMAEAFLGQWINLDQNGGGYSWFTVSLEGSEAVAHFWGQCAPEPCDTGEYRFPAADLDDGQFVFSYEFARGTNSSEIVLSDDMSIEVTTTVDFTEESGIADTTTVYYFQDSVDVTGIPAYVGTWINDQPGEAEYSDLSIALVNGDLVIFAKAIIDGQEHDFGLFSGTEDVDDGDLHIDYEYPGGGLISGNCVPSGDGSLIVTMFAEHMVDEVYTTHTSVIRMRRLD